MLKLMLWANFKKTGILDIDLH